MDNFPEFRYFDFILLVSGMKIFTEGYRKNFMVYLNYFFALHYLAWTYYFQVIKCLKFDGKNMNSDDLTYTLDYISIILAHHIFWLKRNAIRELLTKNLSPRTLETRSKAKLVIFFFVFSYFASAISMYPTQIKYYMNINQTYGMIEFYTFKPYKGFDLTFGWEFFVAYVRFIYIPLIRIQWIVKSCCIYGFIQFLLHRRDMESLSEVETEVDDDISNDRLQDLIHQRRVVYQEKKNVDSNMNWLLAPWFLNIVITWYPRMAHITSKVMHYYAVDLIEITISFIFTFGTVVCLHAWNKKSDKKGFDIATRISSMRIPFEVSKSELTAELMTRTNFTFSGGCNLFDLNLKYTAGYIGTLLTISIPFIKFFSIEKEKGVVSGGGIY